MEQKDKKGRGKAKMWEEVIVLNSQKDLEDWFKKGWYRQGEWAGGG